MYDKEPKKKNDEIFQEIYSDNDINEDDKNTNFPNRKENRNNTVDPRKIEGNNGHPLDEYHNKYNFEQAYKRKQRRVMTTVGRRMDRFKDFELEEDSNKAVSRIKFKKAKIRKFKSHRYELEPEPPYPKRKNGTAALSKHRSKKFKTFLFYHFSFFSSFILIELSVF